jgi:uncharacterized membrane protein
MSQAAIAAAASPKQSVHVMELLVGYILQVGVLLSMILIAVGVVWRWFNTGTVGFDYTISGMNFFEFVLTDIQQMAAGTFRPRLFANLGIATLMLTPYVRVLASMLYFGFVERNRKYTIFTGFVFVVLTYSLFLR